MEIPRELAYNSISAAGQARQHNGNVINQTYNYTSRRRRSDETLREDQRNDRLLKAAAEGQLPRIRHLLRLGVDIDYSDLQSFTALHHAVLSGFEDCVRELIEAGADVNERTSDGRTPLDLARAKQRERVVDILIEARAEVYEVRYAPAAIAADASRDAPISDTGCFTSEDESSIIMRAETGFVKLSVKDDIKRAPGNASSRDINSNDGPADAREPTIASLPVDSGSASPDLVNEGQEDQTGGNDIALADSTQLPSRKGSSTKRVDNFSRPKNTQKTILEVVGEVSVIAAADYSKLQQSVNPEAETSAEREAWRKERRQRREQRVREERKKREEPAQSQTQGAPESYGDRLTIQAEASPKRKNVDVSFADPEFFAERAKTRQEQKHRRERMEQGGRAQDPVQRTLESRDENSPRVPTITKHIDTKMATRGLAERIPSQQQSFKPRPQKVISTRVSEEIALPPTKLLMPASRDLGAMMRAVREGRDIEHAYDYYTVLQTAVDQDNLDAIRELLERGANPLKCGRGLLFELPAHVAARDNKVTILDLMFEHGLADRLQASKHDGETLFEEACLPVAELLLSRYPEYPQWCPQLLHKAALSGDLQKVKLLVKVGMSPCARDVIGSTPLEEAISLNRKEVVRYLRPMSPKPSKTSRFVGRFISVMDIVSPPTKAVPKS